MINDPFFRSYLNQKPSRHAQGKVVSVPIHFVSSGQPQTNQSAALRIQRVFRGFLVRKSIKKISSIENEVCEVERRINDIDVAEMVRRDAKERLRMTETLMSLLFKLDSIRGVDSGVRDFRKAVIKRTIALQEKVDSIVTANNEYVEIDSENDCKGTSEQVPESSSVSRDEVVADGDFVKKMNGEIDESKEVQKEIDGNCNHVEVVDECGVEEAEMVVRKDAKRERTDDNNRNVQLLEKLMDDNEKMMALMTQMFERNEMQTRMLNSLNQRVEQLEKAFMCDSKSRRKKKRQTA